MFFFEKYIYSRLRAYFLFTNIFTHIQQLIFVHIHDRNISSARRNIHSAFSAHPLFRSQLLLISERKVTGKVRPSGMEDQRPQRHVLRWQDLFCSSFRSRTGVRTGLEHCRSRSESEHTNNAGINTHHLNL